MSVALQSPFTGNKRLFDDAETEEQQQEAAVKRVRCLGSPAGRCRPAAHSSPSHFHHTVPAPAVAAVKALFPGMDPQVVENVLAECGQDVDAAIRRLNQLKLAPEHTDGSAQQHTPSQLDTAAVTDDAPSQAHQPAAAEAAQPGPQTADQWVDALVQEMAAAKDFGDARNRAGKLLQAFEQFVTARNKGEAATSGSAQARLEEVTRENAILKRAVQIQNAKLQEASAKDGEIAGLQQMLSQYQERLRQMELSNYSLALHLQKATNDRSQTANRPPDVF